MLLPETSGSCWYFYRGEQAGTIREIPRSRPLESLPGRTPFVTGGINLRLSSVGVEGYNPGHKLAQSRRRAWGNVYPLP